MTKYGKDGWAVSTGPSIADILLFDIVELHERVFGMEKVRGQPVVLSRQQPKDRASCV